MENSVVSVIVSIYNEPLSYIIKSLQSIVNQTYSSLQIIIVIDDPNNKEAIQYIKELAKSDNRVEYYLNDVNKGLVYCLNYALSLVKGEFIARMDADDISDPKRIEEQLNYISENNLDLIGSLITDIDETDREIHGITHYPELNENIVKYLRYGSPLAHPTWFGKKSVFNTLNGYQDIDACEDYDFLCRAVIKGFKLGVIQKSLLNYRINSNGISSTKRSIQKTALYYISKQYKNGKCVSATELNEFINSVKGIKKKENLNRYYHMSSRLKKKRGINYYLYAGWMTISSREARNVLKTICMCKIIIFKS